MQVGIQVVKKVLFRGVQQEFQNVYHYMLATAVTAPSEALIDAIVSIERDFHSADVTFVRGSVWSSGGSPTSNNMLFQKSLTGAGNQVTNGKMDRERAVLIRWPAGKDSKGRNVYLRKWFHCCGNFLNTILTDNVLANIDQIPSANRGQFATSANRLRTIHADLWRLCSSRGRLPTADAECHPYLEHHQLGDTWRG